MTQSLAHSPEADGNARRPRMNSDPTSLFEGGRSPAARMSVASMKSISRVGSSIAASATVTMADTSGIAVGDVALGAGVAPVQSFTTADTNDLFVLAAHGIPVGTPVWLESITTTTGITAGRVYYVVTPGAGGTADNFSLANTPGGAVIAITTNGTATIRVRRFVSAITTNTSITLSAIAPVTLASGVLEIVTMPFLIP